MLLFSKFMWRQGFMRVPEYCSADTPASECMTSCPDEILMGDNADGVLMRSGAHKLLPQGIWGLLATHNFTHEDLLFGLCATGHPGEMFTSAAPYDPIFCELWLVVVVAKSKQSL